jgi:hypothetical protein
VGFSEIWGFCERLPEFSLRFGKLSGSYEFNALIIVLSAIPTLRILALLFLFSHNSRKLAKI